MKHFAVFLLVTLVAIASALAATKPMRFFILVGNSRAITAAREPGEFRPTFSSAMS